MPVWRFDELARTAQPITLLRSPSGAALTFQTAQARLVPMVTASTVVAAGKGETPDWLLVGTPAINAFATYQNGQPLIAVTLGLARLLHHDEGAWAALMGHELAQFRLGHHQAQRSRKGALSLGGSLAGLVLSAAGLGVGSIAADAAETLMERPFVATTSATLIAWGSTMSGTPNLIRTEHCDYKRCCSMHGANRHPAF